MPSLRLRSVRFFNLSSLCVRVLVARPEVTPDVRDLRAQGVVTLVDYP